jgi:transglutaminase-like putative cysteine protease
MMNTWRFIAAVLICVIFVGLEVETWVLAAGIFFLAWKGAIEYWKLAKPSRWLTNTLTVVALGLILGKYRTLMSQDSSAGFLVLLTSLKLLEERTLRDQKFLFLLGFVLISSLMLFSIELPVLVAGLVSFYLLWTAQNRDMVYRGSLLKALPVVVLLFLFFPRVQNPFGLQGYGDTTGQTGFSDDLNPGSIAKIQNNKELAFRVQFLNPKLRPAMLDQYWRGQVLSYSEGMKWNLVAGAARETRFEKIREPDYEVTLEPHNRRWIFALEPTLHLQASEFGFYYKNNAYFEAIVPIRERIVYRGQAAAAFPIVTKPEILDLQKPAVSDRFREFAADLKVRGQDSRDQIAILVLDHYRREKYAYTKSPGTASSSLDEFFFVAKRGYCEHYAAATATLLRLADVPARVVTGYQGGVYNAYGNFWKFTQSDAHAWAEFLNDQNQWQRIDPTSVVAPERLELGGALFEELPEDWIGQNRASEFLKSRESWWSRGKEFVSLSLESFNYDLVIFLLDFNLEKQKELAQRYGFWLIAVAALGIAPFVAWSFYRRRRPSLGEWLLQELERRARGRKLHRGSAETLRAFIARWQAAEPEAEARAALAQILAIYEATEYAPATGTDRTKRAIAKEWLAKI